MANVINTIIKNVDKKYPIGYFESLRPEPKTLRLVLEAGMTLDEAVYIIILFCKGEFSGVEFIGDTLLAYYKEAPTRLGSINQYNDKIKKVILPANIEEIPNEFFSGCTALQSVTIPNSVTTIGNDAFYGCTALQSVTIPNSVTTIGDDAFYGCTALQSVTIPNSVTTIGNGAFSGCTALQSVTIPNSVTTIGDVAFSGCTALQSVTIPNSVTTISGGAFSGCTALTAYLPKDVRTVGTGAFRGVKTLYYDGSLAGAPWEAEEWIHSGPDPV